jgi:hypothetical protein
MLKAIISSFDFLAIRSVLAVCKIWFFMGKQLVNLFHIEVPPMPGNTTLVVIHPKLSGMD